MPKRIIDGEALWGSNKLRLVRAEFRMHFANWIPLAEANGVFEADCQQIWQRVYGCLLPELVPKRKVKRILDEFVSVGLIVTYDVDGKTWGYFVGIDKPGRLPSDRHQSRYKTLPPEPPRQVLPDYPGLSRDEPDSSGNMPEGFGVGVGKGIGIGMGMGRGVGTEDHDQDHASERETDISLKTKITDKASEVLKCRIPSDDNSWGEISRLEGAYRQDKVFDAFCDWAQSRAGEVLYYPLSEFLKVAAPYLESNVPFTTSPESDKVITDITVISQGTVIPNTKQSLVITRWLKDYTAEEVVAAFRHFYSQIADDFQLKFAPRDFCEKGVHLLNLARTNKLAAEEQEALMARQRIRMDREAAALLQELHNQPVIETVEDLFGKK